MTNSDGKWQVAFWVISGLMILGFTSTGGAIVTNDRIRQTEDQRLEVRINTQYQEIIQRLTRIETQVNK